MDIMWLVGFFFGVNFLWGTSFAHISVLPISKDLDGHKTQYRFQYFVRDERGDYKTQEETGEGGNARGSYAVEEPDGDLRIVQYTANLGGGFKAHIKVDHGGKFAAKLQEIDIPAEEMRKLIEENREKSARDEVPEVDKSSKSYVLGPPRKMSDIVMEQAAAIREIISKEIEAEEKREAEERVRNEKKPLEDTEAGLLEKAGEKSSEVEPSGVESPVNTEKKENAGDKNPWVEVGDIHSTPSSNSDSSEGRTAKVKKINDEKAPGDESLRNLQTSKKITSPLVRVALRPRNVDEAKQNPVPAGGSAVRNFSFKNRLTFYKPAEKKAGENRAEIVSEESFKRVPGPTNVGENANEDQEEIVLYSPYEEKEGNEGDRKSRFITVPYEVLRPYLAGIQGYEEASK